MRKILVVNVNWLGDCIMSLPLFKALKHKFPSSYVYVMVPGRVKEIFYNNPYIDEVVEFDERTTHRSVISKIKFVKFLKGKNIDTALFIHRSFTRVLLCMMAGIKQRIGFRRLKTSFLLTKKVRPPEAHRLHRADYYYSLVESLGIRLEDKIPHLTLSDEARGEAAHFLKQYRERYAYLIAINSSANWALKRWPPQNFAQLIKDLVLLNCAVFLIGTKKQELLLHESFISSEGSVVNLCGKTTLSQLAALLSQMDLLISSDSGPAHLAAALDRNVLVLFGPTSPALTAPRGEKVTILKESVNCDIPCYNLKCQDNICMRNITPDAVLDKVKNILTDV